jgi:Cu(I)/Ag(I) efflux system membrane protein CusA/SilA
VFGKVGRAETATDPAPLTMIETFIQLKPRDQWRTGITTADLIRELDHKVNFPGLSDAWVMPIKTRIDMLSTGMKTPLGIKLAGPDNEVLENLAIELESLLRQLPQTRSAYAERNLGGRYLTIEVDRIAAARYGLTLSDVNEWLQMAVGDMPIAETVEGAERYPISLRFPDNYRDTPERLDDLPILTNGALVRLGDIAKLRIETDAHMFKSENGRPNSWIYLDIGSAGIDDYVARAEALMAENIKWPVGYTKRWSGQYESKARVQQSLEFIVPLTLMIIAFLLYLNFRRLTDALLLLGSLPFALVGGLLLVLWLDFKISVAVAVGFIALAGLAVETGAIMLQVLRSNVSVTLETTPENLRTQVAHYASQRLRPVLMTAVTTVAGLTPIMFGQEPGSEIMSRIAAPMIGGLLTSVLLTLFVIPGIFLLIVSGKREY